MKLYEVTKEVSEDRKRKHPNSKSWGTWTLRTEEDKEKSAKKKKEEKDWQEAVRKVEKEVTRTVKCIKAK